MNASGDLNPIKSRANLPMSGIRSRLLIYLFCFQCLLCCFLVYLIRTNWFSSYFNLRMRELLVDTYENSERKDPHLLQSALKYSAASGMHVPEDLDLLEELALGKHGASSEQALMHKSRQMLEDASKNKKLSPLEKELAARKLIRVDLARFKVSFKLGDYSECSRLLSAVKDQLRRLPARSQFSKLEFLIAYIKSSYLLAKAEGIDAPAETLSKLPERLKDPEFARLWYERNGISGYECDYTPDYCAIAYLTEFSLSSKNSVKLHCIEKALDLCRSAAMPQSTRSTVLMLAIQLAFEQKNAALKKRVFDTWWKSCSDLRCRSHEEAIFLLSLLPSCAEEKDAKKSARLINAIFDAMNSDLVRVKRATFLLDDFYSHCQMDGLIDGSDSLAAAKELIDLAKKARALALKSGLRTLSIDLAEVHALCVQGKTELAAERFLDSLREDQAKAGQVNSPQAAQIKFLPLTAAQERTTLEKTGSEKLQKSPPQALALVTEALRLCQLLEKEKGLATADEFFRNFLAFDLRPFLSDDLKVKVFTAKAEFERRRSEGSLSYKPEALKKLLTLSKSQNLSKESSFELDDYLLRSFVFNCDFAQAEEFYRLLMKKYPEKDRSRILKNELGWMRALPSYNEIFRKRASQRKFPEEAFYETEKLVPRIYGQHSPEYALVLLWLAEYEFCKGNKDAALVYCARVLANKDMKVSAAYLPALVLKAEIENRAYDLPLGTISAPAGSRGEIACLWSIFHTSNHLDAEQRCKELEKRIKQ